MTRWPVLLTTAFLTGGLATAPSDPLVSPVQHHTMRTRIGVRATTPLAHPTAAPASPARLANLISAVIFADANTISYRRPIPDGALMQDRAATDLSLGSRRSSKRFLYQRASAVDACPADDPNTPPGHESTITMFFAPDSGTAHITSEYVLWRQANDSTPVVLVRHVLRDGHRPFLEYRYAVPTGTGADSLAAVPRDVLPISRADTTGAQVDVRALRDVEWRFLVVLDATSHPEHIARVHVVTSLPAIDRLDRHECRERWGNRPRLTNAPLNRKARVIGDS